MRLIDADMLIEDLETEATNLIMEGYRGTHRGLELTIPSVIERINEMPTVDITPIALPCKVGDAVYCILFSPKFNKLIVEQVFVESFKIEKTISARVFDRKVDRFSNVDFDVDISEFGKTVFLTLEDAEKALKDYKEVTK